MLRKVVKVVDAKKLEVFDEPVREMGPHDMLVKITMSGICRSEFPTYLGEGAMCMKGPYGIPVITDTVPYPAEFGHEPTGVVLEVGSEVKRFKPGDRISGACGGAFASIVTVSEFAPFVVLPDNVSEYNILAEPVMCCCNIVNDVKPEPDQWISVVGCGYMGLICISLLKGYGVENIVAIDKIADRREQAIALGAKYAFDSDEEAVAKCYELTGGKGFDRSIELSQSLKGLYFATHTIKIPTPDDRGKIAASSVYDLHENWPVQLGFELMNHTPELHFIHPGYAANTPELMKQSVDAHASGILPEDRLITHRFKAEDMHKAYEMMVDHDLSYLKGALVFE